MNSNAETIILRARRIVTMDAANPLATHVAIRDGRILSVGDIERVRQHGDTPVDESFADQVLMPGLVEGHCHVMEGGVWAYPYVGYYDRIDPAGKIWPGLRDIGGVIERLRAAERHLPPGRPLLAWGFDPILLGARRMTAVDLDAVSPDRPILVMHASFHVMNVNSGLMVRAGIGKDTAVHGVLRDEAGQPTGELQEMAAKFMALRVAGSEFWRAATEPGALDRFAASAVRAGVTTVTDLYNDLLDETVEAYRTATADPAFPIRLVAAYNPSGLAPEVAVQRLAALCTHNTERLRFGPVKLMTDGSIQGFSARLKWPGYFNGKPNGLWNLTPDMLYSYLSAFHRAGFQVHIHANGDEASAVTIDALERVLAEAPRFGHRHTIQHCQMADAAQFRRMAELGVCANLFANHIYYWGDAHYAETMGPDRAEGMDAAGTALAAGVAVAIHSDAPITPLAPLFTAWCAMERLTASGRVLGPTNRISRGQALAAITLGAAYTLKLDHEIGSIQTGKQADFAVLEDDPTNDSLPLKEVRIAGTILGGRFHAAPSPG
ncbi:amidohydrolase [Acidiphilium acidophilum]|uniref:amidohydrolase n=1 Tax=Acidiphilium acidophilum TaxID=76588 RepID=UPI002E8E7681|nr:amidohydrolase [Acidiphilium acidophilum]